MSTALWIALLVTAPTSSTDQARALTRRSILEYDTGHYVQALADIERAYELDPRPALLFNLGQCHRALGHHREAALVFKSYLRALPDAKNREQAADLCAQMSELARQDELAQRSHKPAPALAARPPPEPPAALPADASLSPAPAAAVSGSEGGGGVPVGAWWLGGLGLGVGAVGGVLFGLAQSTLGADDPTALPGGATEHHLSSGSFFTAATEANTGEVLWGVGGALLVTGVIVALTASSK